MPYLYQLKNRQRAKKAILAGVLIAFVLALLVFTPARILGWAGLGFGSLTVPPATVAAVDEPVAVALTRVRTPPLIEPYTFPAYTEWSDIETACSDCDSLSYGIDGDLDAVDAAAMSRLEETSGVSSGAGASGFYRPAGTAGGPVLGGGGGGGGVAGAAGAAASSEPEPEAEAVADADVAAGPAEERSASSGASSGGAPEANETSAGSDVPDLILSRVAPGDEAQGGLPADVVQALVESPVGSETVYSAGEPEVISAALDLGETAAAAGDEAGAQQETVPEPVSLLLVGLGLSATVLRQRRAVR